MSFPWATLLQVLAVSKPDARDSETASAEAEVRTQLLSAKPDGKEICKNVKQCQPFSLRVFAVEDGFHKVFSW